MLDNFNDFIKMEAICTYLKSFGYKAKVDNNALVTYVQDPVGDTFVVVAIPTWEVAREFITLRTKETNA